MAILIGKQTRAIVQGITGNQGSFHTRLMLDYGTRIVAGVTPGKGGTTAVGLPSRSGTLTYEIAASLTHDGIGQSTCLGIGGDPFTGLNFVDVLRLFRDDPATDTVVLIGEIGGSAEEDAANHIRDTKYPKRVAAYIAGRAAPPGKRMGHAGAIITGIEGTADAKMKSLREAGVLVAEVPSELPRLLLQQVSPLQ